jgi:ApbE superfamily uncharacterized protein (UPF0280 family)
MPLRTRKRGRFFDVPVGDVVLRVAGDPELYERVRATGLQFFEQIESFGIRQPAFLTSPNAVSVPDDAPALAREMARASATAGVGPRYSVYGALCDFVGSSLQQRPEVRVSCRGYHLVMTKHRARLPVYAASRGAPTGLSVVIKPELGLQGVYVSVGANEPGTPPGEDVVVVAGSCTLAGAAAARARDILAGAGPDSLKPALTFLKTVRGVHGALVVHGRRIGLAGAVELAD